MKTFNFKQFTIEQSEREESGFIKYINRAWRIDKNGNPKLVIAYYYRTDEARQKALTDWMNRQIEIEERTKAAKQTKQEAQKNLINPFKVGDILYNSWGYDQTNIDFYQVVEVGAKSVKIREIGSEMTTKEGYSSMSAFVSPKENDFTGPTETKILRVYANGNGGFTVYIPARHGIIKKYDGTAKYCSWYA